MFDISGCESWWEKKNVSLENLVVKVKVRSFFYFGVLFYLELPYSVN